MRIDIDRLLRNAKRKMNTGKYDECMELLLYYAAEPRVQDLINECKKERAKENNNDPLARELAETLKRDKAEAMAREIDKELLLPSQFPFLEREYACHGWTDEMESSNAKVDKERNTNQYTDKTDQNFHSDLGASNVNAYKETHFGPESGEDLAQGSAEMEVDTNADINDGVKEEKIDIVNANEERNLFVGALQNCLKIRAKVLLMGIETWAGNSNVRPGVNTSEIKLEIEYLLEKSHEKFYNDEFGDAQNLMSTAENWFRYVLPKRRPQFVNATNVETVSDQNKPEETNERASTVVVREITVKGDEFDVAKWLQAAEKALKAGKLDRAERLISKANAIFHTDNARKLTQRVEKAKAEARAAEERSKPKPENIKSEDENRKENKEYSGCNFEKPADPEAAIKDTETATFCMAKAQKAFDSKDFKKAQNFLSKAKFFDPDDPKIKDMLGDVETILSFKKTAVDNHIKNAEDAIQRRYYKEAEKYLTDALLIDPTAEVNDMLTGVRANIEEITNKVRSLQGYYQEARKNEWYIQARDYLLKFRETDPSFNVETALRDTNAKIEHRQDMAKSFLHSADLAIENKNLVEAENMLLKVQALKIHIDVQEKLTFVRKAIKREEILRLVNDAIAKEDYVEAEKLLITVQELGSNEAQDLITYVRTQIASRSSSQIPEKENEANPEKSWAYRCKEGGKPIRNEKHHRRVETPYGNRKDNIESLQSEAEKILIEADQAFLESKLDDAEELVECANRFCVLEKATELKSKIQAARRLESSGEDTKNQNAPKEHSEDTLNTIKSIEIAQKAAAEGKLDHAIGLYEKAQRMYEKENKRPSSRITDAIESLKRDKELQHNEQPGPSSTTDTQNPKVYNTEQLDAINQSEWKRCVEAAVKALDERKYEKANRLLVKAKRIRDSDYIGELIERVRTAGLTQPETTEEEESILAKSLTVEKYVQHAIEMKNDGFIYAAESWLKLANGLSSTDTCKDLMADIETPLNVLKMKTDKEQIAIRKIQARLCTEKAGKCLETDNVDDATTHVIVAQNIFNSLSQARDIMPKILKRKFELKTGDNSGKFTGKSKHKFKNYDGAEKYNKFMSDCYKEAAGTALRMSDIELAKEYLEKAIKHYFNPETKKLLIDVCERENADRGTIRNWLKKFFEPINPLNWFLSDNK